MSDTRPVLVTGASGFIARHILLELLRRGYRVRGSLRSMDRADGIRADLRPHLDDPALADTALEFVPLDLTRDAGWDAALDGVSALIHTASPFPLSQPKDPQDIIRPAVDGTARALNAALAAGVGRVVLTSSIAAVVTADPLHRETDRTEADWSDPDHPAITPYGASKTLAERRAWEIAAADPSLRLTTVNPGLVLGPPVGNDYGSSLRVVERFLKGSDPAVPRLIFDIVDVRDVARLHVVAMENDATAGERLICTAGAMWMPDLAALLAEDHPDRKIPTRVAPPWLMRIVGLFDPVVRSLLPVLGMRTVASAAKVRRLTGIDFIPPRDALRASARFLIESGRV